MILRRTEFTEVDDRNLIAYVAGRLPDPSMRGRTGNKLYQDLCNRVRPSIHPSIHLISSIPRTNPVSLLRQTSTLGQPAIPGNPGANASKTTPTDSTDKSLNTSSRTPSPKTGKGYTDIIALHQLFRPLQGLKGVKVRM